MKVLFVCILIFVTSSGKAQVNKSDTALPWHYVDVNANTNCYITALGFAKKNGFPIVRTINEKYGIVFLTSWEELAIAENKIYATNNDWQLSGSLYAERNQPKTNQLKKYVITINPYSITDEPIFFKDKNIGILQHFTNTRTYTITCKENYFWNNVRYDADIVFVDNTTDAATEVAVIGYRKNVNSINQLETQYPYLNGTNIVVGVKEESINTADLDVYKRVLASPLAATTVDEHATSMATIIGGAGNKYYDGKGPLWKSNFFPSSFTTLMADDAAVLFNNNVLVQNHSYGSAIQAGYGAEAKSYDKLCWEQPNMLHIFSAGNRGVLGNNAGRYAFLNGYNNLTGNYKEAKNVITVGACNELQQIEALSSAGPTYDGRLAPQLVAIGANGTSDAAAIVSSVAGALQQQYKILNSNNYPSAALLKAVMYTTAKDLANPGPDYKTGYGLVNGAKAIQCLLRGNYINGNLSAGQTNTHILQVPSNTAQLQITLSWTDTTSQENNFKALINDLDITLIHQATGQVFLPWVLNSVANIDSLKKNAIRKRDSLHTAEKITIDFPLAGTYNVLINASTQLNNNIAYAIAYNIDSLQTFAFTNPLTHYDADKKDLPIVPIQWNTYVADTNTTGNLELQYNNLGWQTIASNIKLYKQIYYWDNADTNAIAQLRMSTPFGVFYSPQFLQSKIIQPEVLYYCTDSFAIKWNKQFNASSYNIYVFNDSAYLKLLKNTTDTLVTFITNRTPYKTFAVQPVAASGLPTIRSLAFDVNSAGVQCFYKTVYYNQTSPNTVKLFVELTALHYIDSVYFEKINNQGQLLRLLDVQRVANNTILTHETNTITDGHNYFRIRIKLKTNQIVYSEYMDVFTTAEKYIRFYPNPVSKNGSLNYILQQNLSTDSKIYIYNSYGKLIRAYSTVPNKIDISSLQSGIYFFSVISEKNIRLQNNKVIITN